MRSTLLRFAIVACACALMISPVFALSGGSPARTGDRLTRATVFITSLTPSGKNRAQVGNCTGVLIDRDLILTAGHCLSDLGGPSLVVAQFFDRSNRVVGAIQVASGAMHPDYAGRASADDPKPELLGADLAVLKLASPAPADRKPIALADDPVAASKVASVLAGAGLRRPADEGSAGQLRVARVASEVVTDGPTAVALGVAGGMICRGDSGGPVVSSAGLWGIVIAIVRKKSLCNSTVFMAVLDPTSRGFRTMVSRAKKSS
ncbi:S1 family peptidase [Hansschlegelia quercus]|uniref:Trypsin-like serine protease n=1 Tax=Hansschlegelia quercus TaxID=2528245 RepID=A0A4V2JEE7_9HYPH|nr:trypsin-like serine protease [Hansschlegelia quercus]TBN54966.1 trypsin-like serine protease [Hansschlegelia quercus]